ncbi:MAG TPA: LuxR family transcriptional regulator [Ramlibacter sp.]|uniref:helix-turn-helix transcriptional regulator n=1 Tax=Ramlibacter sp. TaxID=1917967 RepID=UPI002C73ED08|nr:LuxR family transcriptional regulator [Ramlibacter sp.]HVZ45006.1 LuxR family transcriptional regulator [Ramlibacter sp.]
MASDKTLELIASITSAETETGLLQRMKRVARSMGYEHVLFGIEVRVPAVGPVQHISSAYPVDYQRLYQHRRFLERDPTVAHCRKSAEALAWHEEMYSEHSYEIMEEAASYGLAHGLSVPVHVSRDVVSMLSLARDRAFESDAERTRVMATASVLANCVHVAASRLVLPTLAASGRPHLTRRELQCFQMVALGKSNWDIGHALHISSETAGVHVKHVLRKLGVSSRMQAVAIGVALGIIKP